MPAAPPAPSTNLATPMANPEIRFDPSFIEEAVFLALSAHGASGNQPTAQAFHTQRAALYDGPLLAETREAAFRQLALRYFHTLGLAQLFTQRFEEFPLLAAHVGVATVRRVWSRKEERVELYRQSGGEASTTLVVDLQVIRCLAREAMVSFLRHELMHICDMLDPVFAYEPHPELGGEYELENDLIRERFRLLWDLCVEGRMRRRDWQTVVEEPIRRREFERIFAPWEPQRREVIWRDLSGRGNWTQRELLELARDERLTRMLGQGGIRCPLCHFPTREGVCDWSGERAVVAEAIHTDYPTWQPSHGACLQCVELYRSRLQLA